MQGSPRRALKRAVAGVSVGALALTGLAAFAAAADATQSFSFTRFEGTDRFGTAAVIATQTFTTADTILVANGEAGHFPDALAGNYLAGKTKSPILLTSADALPQFTRNAITVLKPTKAIILGGTSAVSANVQSQLSALGMTVTRLGGVTRYDTAKLVAEAPGTTGAGSATGQGPTAVLASGAVFADALTAGPLGYANSFPVLITDPTASGVSTQTKQALADLGIKHVLIAGGTAAVTAAAAADLGTGVTSERLAGTTRQLTAVAIANYETSTGGFGKTHVNLARGDDFPDALSGGPHAGTEKAPILLTDNSTTLGAAADAYLKANSGTLTDGHVLGGTAAVSAAAVAQATVDAKGTNTNQATAAITNTNATVAAGQPITFTITSSKAIASVAVSGPCVTSATSSSDTDTTTAGFQGSIPVTSGTAAGSCQLSFAVTFSDGTPAETDTAVVTVGAGAASQTSLPELTSAAITGTVTASQVTPTNPLGTTVAYTFDEPVATAPTGAAFNIYSFDDNPVTGDPAIVGVSGNVVTVRFTNVNTTTNTTPIDNVNNYTLATVVQGAVTDAQGQQNPDGDAAIGTASSTGGGTATANTTTAPDLRSVGNFRQGSAAGFTAVDFTFDQAAFATATGGYSLITPGNTVVACMGPTQGSTTTGGGTIAGGNGTTTITVLCTDANAGTAAALSATNLVRATVDAGTVSDTLAHSAGPATVTNPLEAFHFTGAPVGGTTAPDLVSATLIPRNTGTNTSMTQDQVLYTFDQAVTAPLAADFGIFDSSGTQTLATGGTATAGGTGNMSVLVTFLGTVDASTNITGAFVLANAVNANQPDQRGTTPGSTSTTTITPGQVQAPQLTSVALTSATDALGVVTFTATYTFDKAIGTTAIATAGDFTLFDANGNQLTAMTCAAPTGATATNTKVACTSFTDANTSATTPALVQQDVGAATLGTVDAGAVTGATAPNIHPNPEGASATTGGTGTPSA